MSTILKTAAMSLLSKTLQTFLYKYLSDVDVEGVALPSVYDGSGWALRLSNVKLREGVQLMAEMPGKIKKRRKKRKPPKPPPPPMPNTTTSTAPTTSKHVPNGNLRKHTTTTSRLKDDPLQESEAVPGNLTLEPPSSSPILSRSRTSSTDALEIPIDYDDDDNDGYDETGSHDGSRPPTPVQERKFFSCFTNSKVSGPKETKDSTTTTTNKLLEGAPLSMEDLSVDSRRTNRHPPSGNANENVIPPVTSVNQMPPLEAQEQNARVHPERGKDASSPFSARPPNGKPEENSDDDEYEEYEQPLKLCLGEGGRIGTLDLRLVDKELHIMVEDAFLTIEAYPVEDVEDEETHSGQGMTADVGNKSQSDVTSGISSAAAPAGAASSAGAAGPKPTPKAKPEPKRDTVGDRVLADNPLARAISAIPHLFLRDIRIRLIIRKNPKAPSTETTNNNNDVSSVGDASSISMSLGNEPRHEDTMLEIGIEFLAVTSGEDILSRFQERQDDESQAQDEVDVASVLGRPPVETIPTAVSTVEIPIDSNQYMVRHIRTGRGPTAGISVQVFAAGPVLPPGLRRQTDNQVIWARQQWVATTNFHLFRCSGLDIRARIHLGTKKERTSYWWFYDYEDDEAEDYDYDDFTGDSLLFGIDNVVAPGPQRPLPPIHPQMSRGSTPVKSNLRQGESFRSESGFSNSAAAIHSGADVYTTDTNGIQSSRVPSTFHRISRGLLPGTCKACTHLPCETCHLCWQRPAEVAEDSDLDGATPMPGLVLQVTVRDPLEINVDWSTIDTINLLKTVFTRPRQESAISPGDAGTATHEGKEDDGEENRSPAPEVLQDDSTQTTASTSVFAGFRSSSQKLLRKSEQGTSDAFATYMQPENIQVLGVHLAEVLVRVHVMQEGAKDDRGLAFCYWDIATHCLTMDVRSLLNSSKKQSQDVSLDLGVFTWEEHKGTIVDKWASLGLPAFKRSRADSASTANIPTQKDSADPIPWPTTAGALLDVPPPLETMPYKTREWHGVQLRFISVTDPNTSCTNSMIHVRFGITTVDIQWGFWRVINQVRQQITWGLLGKPDLAKATPSPPTTTEEQNTAPPNNGSQLKKGGKTPPSSTMTYTVQIDSGSIVMKPLVKANMPLTRFTGERSTEAGICFETLLNNFELSYGQKKPVKKKALSLIQVSMLPEHVRMRILLCLPDLEPLEEALELKKELNPFKRTRAVNKGILKMARKLSKGSHHSTKPNVTFIKDSAAQTPPTTRQAIMTEVLKLNDDELKEMWSTHQRHQRRMAKKRKENSST